MLRYERIKLFKASRKHNLLASNREKIEIKYKSNSNNLFSIFQLHSDWLPFPLHQHFARRNTNQIDRTPVFDAIEIFLCDSTEIFRRFQLN